jgi:hypothetical protein
VQPFPVWIFFVLVQVFKWRIGGKKEGGTQGDIEVIYVFVMSFIWLYVYLCESVEVLSRNFVGGQTAAVLLVSGDFLGN